jgi:DNA helicase-2/ATP-dependent DNA helicase PcrA
MDTLFDDVFSSDDVESLFASAPAADQRPAVPSDALLDGLNPPQREAVLHAGSPLLVVAGAGSGKTRVLTRRIAYLISRRDVHPGAILAITFTNKAAAEMRERVAELVGNRSRYMWVATFHSACVRMLRADAPRLGLAKSFSIYDDTDSKRLVNAILREKNLDTKKFPVRAARSWISDQKNALVDVDTARAKSQGKFPQEVYADVYAEYEARLARAEALDFDDLLLKTVTLLRDCPDIRERYRRRFRHVLVDEYQDTNHAQYVLVQLLCGPEAGAEAIIPPELMVVGDSDQSIYAFRGASIGNILHFADDFPGARTIRLEQNYRSTGNILSAANALITHNKGRPEKNLWTDAGDGPAITGYVADTEHDEARFIADEVQALRRSGESRYADTAVFYRTNAQSRALEDVFIRLGLPYRVVGGVKFYERKEIRDAIAYLRVLANPADDVSLERIINVPRRGIGAGTEEGLRSYARSAGLPLTAALDVADTIPGLSPRAVKPLAAVADLLARHRAMVVEGVPADEILRSILDASGYLAELKETRDPQAESRLENLAELIAVATEFVSAAHEIDITDDLTHDDDPLDWDDAAWLGAPDRAGAESESEERSLLGAPEPDDSLAAFLERIALVSDSDEIPDEEQGTVTLMTLHTAKGLEFDTVFVTGFEDGLFPHERSRTDERELEEERRLAYVGLTRARKRLYLTRAEVRTMWGSPSYNPASRFLAEIPDRLIDWRRVAAAGTWATSQPVVRRETRTSPATSFVTRSTTAQPKTRLTLQAGDRVMHSKFGLGTVRAVADAAGEPRAEIDFGSAGVKLLSVHHAPLELL